MPFICGGIPRDKLIGEAKSKYNDLDITTGNASIKFLAEEFANLMDKQYQIKKKVAQDGHVSVELSNLKVDFSSNFIVPGIDGLLKKKGIAAPNDLQREMFSRDFTCNSLLLNLNLKDIIDPTGQGMNDISKKIIKTCLDPDSTFKNNVQRIPRIYYISAKLGFEVDAEIVTWVKNNPDVFRQVKPEYSLEKISKAMEYDKDRTVSLLDATNGWEFVPGLKATV